MIRANYDLEEREENVPIRKGITTNSENFFRTLVLKERRILNKMTITPAWPSSKRVRTSRAQENKKKLFLSRSFNV
jgi:predicted XRE-type DNA-binding protein